MQCKIRRMYLCLICHRRFATENALWTHAAYKHPSSPPSAFVPEISCRSCGCSFAGGEPELELHLLQTGTKQLQQLLGSGSSKIEASDILNSDAGLPAPVQEKSSGGISGAKSRHCHVCEQCGRKFRDRNALWTHVSFKHPELEQVAELARSDGIDSRPLSTSFTENTTSSSIETNSSQVSLISASSASIKCSVSLDRIAVSAEVCSLPHLATNTAIVPSNCNQDDSELLPLSLLTAALQSAKSQSAGDADDKIHSPVSINSPTSSCLSTIDYRYVSSSNSSTALMRSNSSGSLSSRSRSVSSSEEQQLLLLSSEEEQQLMTTVVMNSLLFDHVACLEQRVADLQDYFTRLLVDFSVPAASEVDADATIVQEGGQGMVIMSVEDVQAMEVGAEVVIFASDDEITSPTVTKASTTPSGGGNPPGRRGRRRARKRQTRVPLIQTKGDGDGGLDAVEAGGSLHRNRQLT